MTDKFRAHGGDEAVLWLYYGLSLGGYVAGSSFCRLHFMCFFPQMMVPEVHKD